MKSEKYLLIANSTIRNPEIETILRKNKDDVFDFLFIDIHANEWDICQLITKQIKNNLILVIDIDLCINNAHSVSHPGVKLLKYYRMLEHLTPCILFGRKPINELFRFEPENAILLANGTAYLNINNQEIFGLKTLHQAIEKGIQKNFIKIGLPAISHDWNNLWAIYKLWLVHKHVAISMYGKKLNELLPANIQAVLKSYEGVLYRYFHAISETDVQGVLQLYFGRQLTDAVNRRKQNSEATVVLIDDQTNDGWADIYENIIFGKSNNQIQRIIPKNGDTIEDIFNKFKILAKNEISLVLLDVRLLGEQKKLLNQMDLSGVRVFQRIKRKYPKIPILITTASSKIGVYECFINMVSHPDGYWIKEGIDKHLSTTETIGNYFNLVNQIDGILQKRQEYIKKYLKPYETDLKNEHVVKLINKGFDHVVTDYEQIKENLAFTQTKNKLKAFKKCIIDTNFFLNIGNVNTTLDHHTTNIFQSLVLLSFIFEENLLIHERVLAEILKFSTKDDPNYDKDISVAARKTLGLVKRLLKNKKITVYEPGKVTLTNILAENVEALYADDKLVETIHKLDKKGEAILFISNDRALNEKIKFTNTNSQKSTCETILTTFKPVLDSL
ncbi:hypothetical protein EGI22_16005 [Lacihabitans sp. LS3-19]|uniref:hypothetical protein n=1 Tax=Lacihabitans sp. LS3-19 TaxID=2487335 RepID=UPI0020CF1394|nr:hypothetical protein [Lacihabitans sp. LS3-19]MCP9769407.1 hypothetical protein [Lacihabitans sp. LS3-19]